MTKEELYQIIGKDSKILEFDYPRRIRFRTLNIEYEISSIFDPFSDSFGEGILFRILILGLENPRGLFELIRTSFNLSVVTATFTCKEGRCLIQGRNYMSLLESLDWVQRISSRMRLNLTNSLKESTSLLNREQLQDLLIHIDKQMEEI